jgi:hypothetical protein
MDPTTPANQKHKNICEENSIITKLLKKTKTVIKRKCLKHIEERNSISKE